MHYAMHIMHTISLFVYAIIFNFIDLIRKIPCFELLINSPYKHLNASSNLDNMIGYRWLTSTVLTSAETVGMLRKTENYHSKAGYLSFLSILTTQCQS